MLPAHLLPLPLSDTAAAALSVVCIIREVTDELRDLDAYAKFKFKKHKRLFHPRHIKAHEQLAKKKRDEQEKEQEQGHEDDDDDDDDSDRFACSVQSVERSRAALLSVYAKPKLCMPCAHTCLHARTHAHTHTHRHTDTHIHTHTHRERHTHRDTETHAHTHTYTHTHTQAPTVLLATAPQRTASCRPRLCHCRSPPAVSGGCEKTHCGEARVLSASENLCAVWEADLKPRQPEHHAHTQTRSHAHMLTRSRACMHVLLLRWPQALGGSVHTGPVGSVVTCMFSSKAEVLG